MELVYGLIVMCLGFKPPQMQLQPFMRKLQFLVLLKAMPQGRRGFTIAARNAWYASQAAPDEQGVRGWNGGGMLHATAGPIQRRELEVLQSRDAVRTTKVQHLTVKDRFKKEEV